MKFSMLALCLVLCIGSASASPKALDRSLQGTYYSIAISSDKGSIWVPMRECLGKFSQTHLILTAGHELPYERVIYADYNGIHYTFIQLNLNDIIEITAAKQGNLLMKYLQNGKEVERYICRIESR